MDKSVGTWSDEKLLAGMLSGDGECFDELYRRWQSSVYRFALRLSGSGSIAEDVTHDVFMALMRDGGQYRGEGRLKSYLLSMARHGTMWRLKRERRYEPLETDDGLEGWEARMADRADSEPDPLEQMEREEAVSEVRRAVMGLPLHYREVVLLCHFHELSYAEAAEVLGCGMGTIASRLNRAKILLTKSLRATAAERVSLRR